MLLNRISLRRNHWLWTIALVVLAAAVVLGSRVALASREASPTRQASPLHPTFSLLDSDGGLVQESGRPVSTMQTCGSCHDTEFIADHSFHASAGLDDLTGPGQVEGGHPWDISSGIFGRWNPIDYRYLSPLGSDRIDLGTAAWVMEFADRHPGGGPAVASRSGDPLLDLKTTAGDPETSVIDSESGELIPWDWQESGVVELNCFLCHTVSPNNTARIQALESGSFQWANTATLMGTGIVEQSSDGFTWNKEAFQENGELKSELVSIQDPTNENCGQCHGVVHTDLDQPLVVAGCTDDPNRSNTTGQVISAERISESGSNLADKESLTRSWDIHAERQLRCTDCHYSLNNPVYALGAEGGELEHLIFDPRRLEIGEYLLQPSHQFARGQSAQSVVAPELKDTMRRCESCHSIEVTHDWLPYKDRHTEAVSCETCHIPRLYDAAYQQYDWTVLTTDSQPLVECRGIQGASGEISSLITGFQPTLLQRSSIDGETRLAPFNLVTSWYWVYGDPPQPVRLIDLQDAWLEEDGYPAEILALFDASGDGVLAASELAIDSPEKEGLIAGRLERLGLSNPRISGEIQPYSINHNVAHGDWATRECQSCHSEGSRIDQPTLLASYAPGGVLPEFVSDGSTKVNGEIVRDQTGALYFQPASSKSGLYVLGLDSVRWIDLIGSLAFAGVLLTVGTHGGMRFLFSLRQPHQTPELQRVYMYTVYERFWHWLQTFTILGLLFTGLIIHKPDTFGLFGFRGVVLVHNVLAGILLVNAMLSLFYHLASGEIKQYIPRPYGFVDDAIAQAVFYAKGIFKGDRHPFEKTTRSKFNPLQQITYFAILNILLPLQVITGALIWGVQRWPQVSASLGGLPFLAPFHTLIAWLFASFIVAHVYLTTTGHAPLAGIKSMMMGWDELETRTPTQEEANA